MYQVKAGEKFHVPETDRARKKLNEIVKKNQKKSATVLKQKEN